MVSAFLCDQRGLRAVVGLGCRLPGVWPSATAAAGPPTPTPPQSASGSPHPVRDSPLRHQARPPRWRPQPQALDAARAPEDREGKRARGADGPGQRPAPGLGHGLAESRTVRWTSRGRLQTDPAE
jgi:hypothetical protein